MANGSSSGTAEIMVNLSDGTRQALVFGAGLDNALVRILDGFQKEVSASFYSTPNILFHVPFYDGPGDQYTVIASASRHSQSGFTPVRVSPSVLQVVDLMLLPNNAKFDFTQAAWVTLKRTHPQFAAILAHGAAKDQDAETRYQGLMTTQNEPSLACLLNLITAMAGIHLPTGTPLDYIRELIWTSLPEESLFAPTQDRFYAWADPALVTQVKTATQHGEFAPEFGTGLLHSGATSSFKQVQFGEANVQLTFHENNKRTIDGMDCIAVEPDIDYYKDLGAHALLEVIPNMITGGLSDPKVVYVLRWIAGRHAGVADFNPPYVIVT